MISAYYPKENDRTHMDLYYSYSQDNINYTTAEKIFSPSSSSNAFDNRGLYRSSFLYANGRYYMFYSALNKKPALQELVLYAEEMYIQWAEKPL